jgi:hypothetical protein
LLTGCRYCGNEIFRLSLCLCLCLCLGIALVDLDGQQVVEIWDETVFPLQLLLRELWKHPS